MRIASHKSNHFFWAVIKIVIVGIALLFIWQKIDNNVWTSLNFYFKNFSNLYIAILLLLTVTNWFLEILKWQTLASAVSHISLKESIKQTLLAHFIGFLTPAKAGDYGAKALFFPKATRKKILFLNFFGNGFQMLATSVFGIAGLGYVSFFKSKLLFIVWIVVALVFIGLALFFRRWIVYIQFSIKQYSVQKIWRFVGTLLPAGKAGSRKRKDTIFLLSFARYLVFAHQFYLLLLLFEIPVNYPLAMALIASTYLVSSIIPVMQFFGVVMRGGAVLLVFGWMGIHSAELLLITSLMWLFNTVLPLLPGSIYLLQARFSNSSIELS